MSADEVDIVPKNSGEISGFSEDFSQEICKTEPENVGKVAVLVITDELTPNSEQNREQIEDKNSSVISAPETPGEIILDTVTDITKNPDNGFDKIPSGIPDLTDKAPMNFDIVIDMLAENSTMPDLEDYKPAKATSETQVEMNTEPLKRTLDDLSDENSDCEVISSKVDENKPESFGYLVDNSKAEWFRSIVSYDSSDSGSDSESSCSSSSSICSGKSNMSDSVLSDCKSDDSLEESPKKFEIPRTKGELTLDDLPPIEDLKISVTEHEMVQMGVVHAIVDNLVVVQSYLNFPALDLDSVLFFSTGKPMGKVFDVLGPVIQPLYSIRFNSGDHIKSKGIEKNMPIFCAPNVVDATAFVFIAQLARLKGSDASWQDNNEPPPQFVDYSDDEEEKKAKAMARNQSDQNGDKTPSRKPRKERKYLRAQRRTPNLNESMQGGAANGGTQEMSVVRPHGNFQFNPPSFQPRFPQIAGSHSDSAFQIRPQQSSFHSNNIPHNPFHNVPSHSYPRFPPHRFGAPMYPFRYDHPPPNPRANFNPRPPHNSNSENQGNAYCFPPRRF